MVLSFVKLSSAGNDFILLDADAGLPAAPEALARRLCARRRSVGADGLLVLEEGAGAWSLAHYGPDGARAFCLNGTRGAAAWLVASGAWAAGSEQCLHSDAGRLRLRATPSEASVALPWPSRLEARQVEVPRRVVRGAFAEVGNPQFVVPLPTLAELEAPGLMELGRELRHCRAFPEGANVSFLAAGPEAWHLRTYERGVEAETLACGTAVLAAACALQARVLPASPAPGAGALAFRTRGGELLSVGFPARGDAALWATGPVRLIARGELWEG